MQQLTIPPSTSNTQTQIFSLNDFFDESEISKKSNISIFELTGDKNDNDIVDFADFSNEDYDKLEKVGNNYYTGGTPIYDARVEVRQNMLESSNIDSAEQIVKLMEIKRQFETNQKFVKMQDDTLEKAANQIGRV